MLSGRTKLVLLCLAIVLGVLAPGIILGVARVRRDAKDAKTFRLVRSLPSPDRSQHALLFEHIMRAGDNTTYQEIVVITHPSTIRTDELWLLMKSNKTVATLEGSAPRDIDLSWENDSKLEARCVDCQSEEVTRRATKFHDVELSFVGFPQDAAYTNTEAVEN